MLIAEQIARLWRDGFIEFVDFGFNPGTIGFIGAITLAILGGVGQYHQLMKIRKGETGKGVSTLWTLSFAALPPEEIVGLFKVIRESAEPKSVNTQRT
jgi:hypothetical protein